MAFNFQNLEIFLLSLIINDNPGKNIYELDIKSTKKYKKNTKNTQYAYKVHNKEKIGQKKNHCIGSFDEIILIVWHFDY